MATTTCPECGAVWAEGQDCQIVFDALQLQEVSDPAYYAVHFLSVSTFFLQHGRYSDEALGWLLPTMRAYLAGQTTTERIRRDSRAALGQGQRTWRVMRQPGALPQRAVAWDVTLADVSAQTHDAPSYCAAVTAWAARAVAQWEGGGGIGAG